MLINKKSKLVMIGDSITDCDRSRPVGEGLFGAIGKGYAGLVSGLLLASYPEREIHVVNMGISGNTVRDLKQRWQSDVIDLKPDWLSVMIGTNDVWRQFDTPYITQNHVYLPEYEETLEELVSGTLPTLNGMVLMTPFYMEANRNDPMRAKMDEYGTVVKKLAEKYNTLFVDTQAAFDKVLEHRYPAYLGWDRVHPGVEGHTVLAKAFLNAVEYEW